MAALREARQGQYRAALVATSGAALFGGAMREYEIVPGVTLLDLFREQTQLLAELDAGKITLAELNRRTKAYGRIARLVGRLLPGREDPQVRRDLEEAIRVARGQSSGGEHGETRRRD